MGQLVVRAVLFVTLSIFMMATASPANRAPSLCNDAEEVLFSCAVKSKTISLCASTDASATTGHLTYRFGKIGRAVELEYPSTPIAPGNAFRYARDEGAKGGSEQLAFVIGSTTYTVYSYHWGGVEPERVSGVLVEKDGEHISNIKCTNPDTQLGMYYLGEDVHHYGEKLHVHFVGLPSGEFRSDVP